MAGPSELEIIGLGAFAGFTIYLGMPFARARGLSDRTRALLSSIATGILLFIFYDVLKNASGLVRGVLVVGAPAPGLEDAGILLGGLAGGVALLVAFEKWYGARVRGRLPAPEGAPAPTPLDPKTIATMVAVGIGLHNFSEGLAIGTSFATGGLELGTVLVIGFAIHNSTEGFGILGPGMMAGLRFSLPRVAALGMIGGAPTFLGTIVGSFVRSDPVSILFYGLAAGAILHVILHMVRPMLGPATKDAALTGIVVGFALGYVTDLVVTLGGG